MVHLTMFISAFICSLDMQEDDGSCIPHQSEESCLEETSIFDTSETKCLWDDVKGECNFHEINQFNLNLIIASLLLTLTLMSIHYISCCTK